MNFNRFESSQYKEIIARRGIRDIAQVPHEYRSAYKQLSDLAVTVAEKHNVPPIPVVVNVGSRRVVGRYVRMMFRAEIVHWIELSHYFMMGDPVEMVDTVKHEMAHYINWVRNKEDGHGPRWVSICQEVGCTSERYYKGQAVSNEKEAHLPSHLRGKGYKWVYKCSCGRKYYRTRRYTENQAYCRLCLECSTRLTKMELERIG